jgi:ribonuclease HI
VLAYFVADWTEPSSYTEGTVIDTPWHVYCDGGWGVSGAGAATILISPSGIKLRYAACLQFTAETNKCSNNVAEYKAVLLGLCKLRAMGVPNYILKIDSKVIAGQIEKECMARDATFERYLATVRRMENYFEGLHSSILKGQKKHRSRRVGQISCQKSNISVVCVFQTIEDPFMKTVELEPRMVNIIEGEDWRALIMAYLRNHYEPDNNT